MTDRRARFLEVLGITHEWLPRGLPPLAAEAAPLAEPMEPMEAVEAVEALAVAPVEAMAPLRDDPAVPVPQAVLPPARLPQAAGTGMEAATPAVADMAAARPPAPSAMPPHAQVPVPARQAVATQGEADGALSARAAGIASLDWPALEAQVSGCTACKLCSTRTQTVFGVGDPQADWMLVGEAPGENEDKQGEPFVGQAGKLLDNMLGSLGLARGNRVFIANVLKCRPPGNRNPEPEEVVQCEPFLKRQIALIRPRLIVVLGRFAAQSLLRTTTPISKLRGTVHSYEGIPVVVTYHPAYLLRTPADKARAWDDLCLAREVHDRAGAEA